MPAIVIDRQPKAIFHRRSHRTASIAPSSERPVRYCNNITLANSDGGIDGRPRDAE